MGFIYTMLHRNHDPTFDVTTISPMCASFWLREREEIHAQKSLSKLIPCINTNRWHMHTRKLHFCSVSVLFLSGSYDRYICTFL